MPGVQSCPEDDQAARMHPLGFFAAEGARQLCHAEGTAHSVLAADPKFA